MKNRLAVFAAVVLAGTLGYAADHQYFNQVKIDYITGNAGGLTNLLWSSVVGTPVSIAGYGITNQIIYEGDSRLSNARTPTAHDQGWATITNTPVSLAGYGITDTVVKVESDPVWSGVSGTVVYTNDSRLTDARTPTAHNQAWSTITNTPVSVSGYGITNQIIYAGDSRLTDARTPTAHNHAWSDINSGVPTSVEGYGITNAVVKANIGSTVQGYSANLTKLAGNDGGSLTNLVLSTATLSAANLIAGTVASAIDGSAITNLNLTSVVTGGKFVMTWAGSTCTVYAVNAANTVSNKMGTYWAN